MVAIFRQRGETVDYRPGSAMAAGDVVVQGDLVGVVQRDVAAGALGSLAVEGVYDFPKATGASSGITAGSKVYWDATGEVATTDDDTGANKLIGKVVTAAGDDDGTVRIRLNQ